MIIWKEFHHGKIKGLSDRVTVLTCLVLQIRQLSLEGKLPTFALKDEASSHFHGSLWKFSFRNLEQSFHQESFLNNTENDPFHEDMSFSHGSGAYL